MGHSRTPTQNTAGDGFPADPIDGSRAARQEVPTPPAARPGRTDVRDRVVL